jgi:2-hydroxychromene-2-carboxylate isomerase
MTKTPELRRIEMIFDFASPNAYLAYHALTPLLAKHDATLELTPCLLGGIFKATSNQAPMIAFANVAGKLDYEMLEMRRFIARYGLTRFRMNPHFPVNSLLLMRAMIAAGLDAQHAYVKVCLAAMWEDGKPMADPATVAQVLTEAGLNADQILAGAQTDPVKQTLVKNTETAVKRGAFGIPTFFVGEEMYFGKDRIPQMLEYLTTGVP